MTVKAKADAIDRFVRTLKSGGLYDDINAACIMAGWTNLAGALYPLKGAAPTNGGGLFQNADLDPGIGLKGNGSTKYLDSNRAENADSQNDAHISVFSSSPAGSGARVAIGSTNSWIGRDDDAMYFRRNQTLSASIASQNAIRFLGASRANESGIDYRINNATYAFSRASTVPSATTFGVFRQWGGVQYTEANLSWYSIGSATDLAALDSAVSTLMADLRAIDEDGFEPESVNYLRAVEAADGAYLETGVKQAINRFVVGCKKDGIWDALKASCILCGARTIAGALVPLAGTAPTAYNFVSANYNRETGLVGVPASGTYIDTNRAGNASDSDDTHLSLYFTSAASGSDMAHAGYTTASIPTGDPGSSRVMFWKDSTNNELFYYLGGYTFYSGAGTATGFLGLSSGGGSSFASRLNGTQKSASFTWPLINANYFVFARNNVPGASTRSDARIAFYSVGTAISDLSLLDARVSTLVSQIAAAIP